MADQLGRRVTYSTPVTADHREILAALYAWFLADNDPNWGIKAGAVIPAQIAAPGDKGFVLTDKAGAGIDIAIADHAAVGGTMVNGAAPGAADDVLISIDPGGEIADITSAGWDVGTRWSGWTKNAEGPSYSSHVGVAKISSGATWLFMRFKSSAGYPGGCWAGAYNRLDAGIGQGYCVASADQWEDMCQQSVTNNCAFDMRDDEWTNANLGSSNQFGPYGNASNDGSGNFRTTAVCLQMSGYSGGLSTTVTYFYTLGTVPGLMIAANGSAGRAWKDSGGDTVGYNMDGGSWIALDDGTDPE